MPKMKTIIKVENIRCSGCFRSIGKEIGIIAGVYGVNVDIANKTISVDHTEEVSKDELTKKLNTSTESLCKTNRQLC